jgi:type IV secretory pathway TraG/TraD family ATPase VirD4
MVAALQLLVVALSTVLFGWGAFRAVRNGFQSGKLGTVLVGLAVLSLLTIPMLLLTWKGAAFALTSGHPYEISEVRVAVIGFSILVGLVWLIGLGVSSSNKNQKGAVLRGSQLFSSSQLMTGMYGKKLVKKVLAEPSVIGFGDVIIPPEKEAQHLLFSGTTGSGKTQAINRVLKAVRYRKKRAMITDAGGGFVSRFYKPDDVILNPFDKRSVDWSPFAEIRSEYDCARIAKATVPDGSGEAAQWHHYAQTLLGETMLAMTRRGQRSIKQLMHYLTVSDSKELGELLAGTPAGILCVKGNDKMLSNTRGIISTFLVVWRYLPDNGKFSIRDWIRDESASSWLFVTFRDDQLGMLRTLIATLLEIGIIEALSLPEDPARDLWFIMDEVDSLGKVTSLSAGLSKLRKYGCKCVLGLQTIAQLRATYGDDGAQSLLANMSTKLVLRAGDGETAEYFSLEFGDQEVEREQHSTGESSSGSWGSNTSTSSNVTSVRETKRTVLASSISGLSDLCGLLKLSSQPVTYVVVAYQQIPQVVPSFVENDAASIGGRVAALPAYSPAVGVQA